MNRSWQFRMGIILTVFLLAFLGFGDATAKAAQSPVNVKLTFPRAKPITVESKLSIAVSSKPKVKVKYASSSAKVATVDALGVVTGVSVGRATITATVNQQGYRGQASFAVTVVPKPLDEREGSASTDYNMVNGSYIVDDDTSLYVIQMNGNSGDGGPIYKIDKNDPSRKKLLYNGKAMDMVKQGEWIYFSDRQGLGHVHKIKTDGTGLTRLNGSVFNVRIWTPAQQLMISSNWLYYGAYGQINKIMTDGTKEQVVFQDPDMINYFIDNGMVYYVYRDDAGESGIRKAKLGQSGNETVVTMDTFNGNIAVRDGWIYYTENKGEGVGYYRIRTDGTGNELLTEGFDATLFGDWIYYAEHDGIDYSWYRMKVDGSGKERVSSIVSNRIRTGRMPLMLGGKLYYAEESDLKNVYEVDEHAHRRSIIGTLYVRTIEQLLDAQQSGAVYETIPEDDEMEMNEQAVAKAKEVIASIILPDMTDDQKLKAVHDYIVLNSAYDYENYLQDTIPDSSYRVYGLMLDHIAVCDGYARTLKLFMDLLGIENYYVYGTIRDSGESHAWNVVKIDGKYYQVDTTWDDPVPDLAGRVSYDYYKVSDALMNANREWDHSLAPATE